MMTTLAYQLYIFISTGRILACTITLRPISSADHAPVACWRLMSIIFMPAILDALIFIVGHCVGVEVDAAACTVADAAAGCSGGALLASLALVLLPLIIFPSSSPVNEMHAAAGCVTVGLRPHPTRSSLRYIENNNLFSMRIARNLRNQNLIGIALYMHLTCTCHSVW